MKWNEFAIIPNSWGIVGVVILGFVFVKRDFKKRPKHEQEVILNHERIHVIPFYIWYLMESMFKGYRNNRFESEAYMHEKDLLYLSRRKRYNYVNNR